jgi:hypothetical protein
MWRESRRRPQRTKPKKKEKGNILLEGEIFVLEGSSKMKKEIPKRK